MPHRRFDLSSLSEAESPRPLKTARAPVEAASRHEPRLALVIGNARYRDRPLANPVRDARDVAWGLEGLGFSVRLLTDATLPAMQEALVAYADAVDAAGSDAVAFVYYAGHGVQAEGANFLIPIAAEITGLRHLATRAMPLDTLARELGRRARKATVIVLDTCRNEFVEDGSGDASATQGMVRSRLPRPTELVYSTAATASAEDGWGNHSPFALALIEEMPGLLVPGTRIQDVVDTVAAKVSLWTANTQTVAVYREGALPPLTLTAEDEVRRRSWSRRPRRPSRRRVAARIAAGAAALSLTVAGGFWFAAYPETRTGLLLRAGLLDGSAYDFACAPPWDGQLDRYGLTRRDWCLSLSNDAIVETGMADRDRRQVVEAGFAAGDPKALALKAMAADRQARQAEAGDDRARLLAEAAAFGRRAAATDLPRGRVLGWMLGDRLQRLDVNLRDLARDLDAAGARGVLLAKLLRESAAKSFSVLTGHGDAADPAEGLDTALSEAAASDPSGKAAYAAAQLYRSGSAFAGGEVQIPRYHAWLRRAASAGLPAATAEWLDLAPSDPALRLSETERRDLMAAAAGADDPPGLYWRARLRMEADALDGAKALRSEPTASLLRRSAEAGFPAAIQVFIDDALDPRDGHAPDMAQALLWLRRAAAAGSGKAAEQLATLLAHGYRGADGAILVAPDPAAARALAERHDLRDAPWALALRADMLRYGALAQRDPAQAIAIWRFIEQRLPAPEIALRARTELDRAWTEASLARDRAANHAFASGDANAPVTVTAFLAADCPACQRFAYDVLRPAIMAFSDPATVRFEVRPVWRDDDAGALEAALVAACAAIPADRFRLFVALMNAQAEWARLATAQERLGAFARLLDGLAGVPDDPARCVADEAARAALGRQRDGFRALPIAATPSVFVGGAAGDTEWVDALKALIASQLPP